MSFYGKYRGRVEDNVDPMERGRCKVSVPVLGDGLANWAEACVPYAGDQVGLFAVPPIGASVWVEFEEGDRERPILTGCFWAAGQVPVSPAVPDVKMWKTDAVTLTLDDSSGGGGLTIDVGPPAVSVAMKIVCDDAGIELSIGASKVVLSTSSVSVNDGALEVI